MRSLPSVVGAVDIFLLLLEKRKNIQLSALSQSKFIILLDWNVNMMNRPSGLSQDFFFWPNVAVSLYLALRRRSSQSWGCFKHCLRVFVYFYLFIYFTLQQAFNATAVIRHMRRLQLGTSTEGPNPNLLLPDEDAGTCLLCVSHNIFPVSAE